MFNCNVYLCNTNVLNVDGVINFENAVAVMQEGVKLLSQAKVVNINLYNLKHADSSSLAVISAWIRYADEHNKILTINSIPKFLLNLSKASNLESIFPVVIKT